MTHTAIVGYGFKQAIRIEVRPRGLIAATTDVNVNDAMISVTTLYMNYARMPRGYANSRSGKVTATVFVQSLTIHERREVSYKYNASIAFIIVSLHNHRAGLHGTPHFLLVLYSYSHLPPPTRPVTKDYVRALVSNIPQDPRRSNKGVHPSASWRQNLIAQ